MQIIKGGVTAPKGFLANAVRAGIKKSGKLDFALLYSEVPAVTAGAFTTNKFQASPVKVSKLHLKNKAHHAIIVNSGNANCANGRIGDRDAFKMTEFISQVLLTDPKEVLVASTGIIGKHLPVDKMEKAVPDLIAGLSAKGADVFAEAIMTTDTVKKELAVKVKIGSSAVTIAGACKGVGMIYPEMKAQKHATMLAFITTDAAITKAMLSDSLGEAVSDSFNMVSVDADMSTNDSCFVMANGLAGNKKISSKGKDYAAFTNALKFLTKELAKKMAADGEGATKFIEVLVTGAKSASEAKTVARKITVSNLFKCCVYGEDPNWGRIAAAAGSSGVDFNPDKVDIYLGNIKALSSGASVKDFDRNKAHALFKKKDVFIKVDLNSGNHSATAWTCDFSKEYVAINSEYST